VNRVTPERREDLLRMANGRVGNYPEAVRDLLFDLAAAEAQLKQAQREREELGDLLGELEYCGYIKGMGDPDAELHDPLGLLARTRQALGMLEPEEQQLNDRRPERLVVSIDALRELAVSEAPSVPTQALFKALQLHDNLLRTLQEINRHPPGDAYWARDVARAALETQDSATAEAAE
jgi:hypothetical protein